jgi:tRNA threonylcarbamoyladenosine biosynthesis protein TsaB
MSKYSIILAIDTAMNGCGVSVFKNGKAIIEMRPMMQGQGEHLMPLVQEVMERAGAKFEELQAVVTTNGPGAFTGLRIGLSAAKSIALARDIPLYGIATLQALALQYAEENKNNQNIAVVIETKREDFYFQLFDAQGRPLEEPAAISTAEVLKKIENAAAIGDGMERLNGKISKYILPDPGAMAEWLVRDVPVFTENPQPLYLRAPDVMQSKETKRAVPQ